MDRPLPDSPDRGLLRAEYICPHCAKRCKGLIQYYGHVAHYHEQSTRPLRKGKRAVRAPLASELLDAMGRAGAGVKNAAAVLGVSKPYFIKWAKILIPEEYAEYCSVPLKQALGRFVLTDWTRHQAYLRAQKVLSGQMPPPKQWVLYPHKQMNILCKMGLMVSRCEQCGFEEHRITDYRAPLLIDFIDGSKLNWEISNIRILCYNCYFLSVRDLWGKSKTTHLSLGTS